MEYFIEIIYECNKSLVKKAEKEIAIGKVTSFLLSLDENMLKILSKNIRVRIRDDLWEKNSLGIFNRNKRKDKYDIFISIDILLDPNFSNYSSVYGYSAEQWVLLHEIGHYFDHLYSSTGYYSSWNNIFFDIYKKEYYFFNSRHYREAVTEFFAQSFFYTYIENLDFKVHCPRAYTYLKKFISTI